MQFKGLLSIIFCCLLAGCSSYNSGRETIANTKTDNRISGSFVLAEQVAPPPDIQSLQLHPTGNEAAPPIIELGQSSLTLEFDHLGSTTQQFRLTLSHRGINWEESPIPPNAYLSGFYETTFTGGQKSLVRNPAYFHYSYTFPNERFQITKSGNYLLSVYNYASDELLFRIPFFVTEDAGKLQTRIQSLFTERKDGRTLAQPTSTYRYPNFVKQPQFDLSFFYVQNQFWGRARETDLFDTATPGAVNFHLGREKSFLADYEFNVLELRSFQPDGRQIIDYQPGQTPPVITLRRDVQQFEKMMSRFPGTISGQPSDERRAEYGQIKFSLETGKSSGMEEQIYLVGDFNNWVIAPRYRMRYDSTSGLWEGDALVKQGIYSYKYVTVKDGMIDDLALDRSFTDPEQEYLTFVYFLDPESRFYRLLKVDRLVNQKINR